MPKISKTSRVARRPARHPEIIRTRFPWFWVIMDWEMRLMIESSRGHWKLHWNGKWEMRSVESRNEIDRVALQMWNETIESRSVEIALGNGKWDRSSREMRSIESRPVEIALKWEYKSSLHTILHTNDDYAKLCYFMLNYAPYAKLCPAMLLLCKLCLMLGLCDYATKQCWHNRAPPTLAYPR